MRKVPREVIVNEEVYKIKLRRNVIDGDKQTLGQCNPGDRLIEIRMCQTNEEFYKTLIHELLHAIEFEWFEDECIPHHIIYKLEEPIFRLIWDNFLKPARRR